MWSNRIVAFCLLMAVVVSVSASEMLEEVRVIADHSTSQPNIDQVDIDAFSGFARHIEREDFSQQVVTASDVLTRTNGVQIRQIGGYGGYASVSMRGSGGKQVNIYLDGMLLNSAQSGGADLNLIPTSILQRIEVYPDFTPVQLGGANIGGAINIITADVFRKLGEVSIARGSFGLERYSLVKADSYGGWNFLVGGDFQAAINDFEVFNDNNTEFNPDDDRWERQFNGDFRQRSLLFKAGKQWQDSKLELLLNAGDTDKGVPAIDNNQENKASLETDIVRSQLKFNHAVERFLISNRLYYTRISQVYEDRFGTVGIDNEYLETVEEQWGTAAIVSRDWWNNVAYLNLEFRQESIEETSLYNWQKALDAQRKQILVGLQNDAMWFADDLKLSLGLVSVNVDDYVDIDTVHTQGFIGSTFDDNSAREVTRHAGIVFQLFPRLKVKANLADQVRLPTLQERFAVQGQFVGNPDLKSESARAWDAGWVWEGETFSLQYSYFAKQLDDAIVMQFDGQGFAKARNINSAEINGSEWEASWIVAPWLSIGGGATLLDSVNTSNIRAENGKKLPGIYHEKFYADLTVYWQHWLFRLMCHVEDDLFYNATNIVWPGKKEVVSMEVRWASEQWSVQLNAKNVLDEQYQDFNRYWGPGRSFDANLTIYW